MASDLGLYYLPSVQNKDNWLIWVQMTPKCIFWQTVKTQMKCSIMLHFIRFCTVCLGKKRSSERKVQFYLKILTLDPSIYTMDNPKLTSQIRRKNSLVHKGLNMEFTLIITRT